MICQSSQSSHSCRSLAPDKQRGSTILEGLIAIFIFSIAILGMVGMLAASVRHVSSAQYRTEAAFLVDSLLAQIRMADPNTRATNYASSSGQDYLVWKNRVDAALPGASTSLPTVTFGGTDNKEVTVVIHWRERPDATEQNEFKTVASLE